MKKAPLAERIGVERMKYTVSLKLNHVFQRLYRKGQRSSLPTLALYTRPNGRKENRLGLTTGTKLGHAVVRNKLRRRMRAIYRLNEDRIKCGYDIVVVFRMASVNCPYRKLEKDFLRLMKRHKLLLESGDESK